MRFMIFVPANKDSEAGVLPNEQQLVEMGKFNEALVKAGVLLAGEGLQPTAKGARVQFGANRKTTVVDGPFAEAPGLMAGFWLIQVKSKDEAVAWMKRAPFDEGTVLEIRQVFETEDFAPSDPTGEVRAAEERLRARIPS
jgi:hypothetical protein